MNDQNTTPTELASSDGSVHQELLMEVIMNRAAIYARLSLADEKSTSTKRQAKDCRDHAKLLGLD